MDSEHTLHLAYSFAAPELAGLVARQLEADHPGTHIAMEAFLWTQLSEYLVAAARSSSPSGTVVLLRLEDWLREEMATAPLPPARDAWLRQLLRARTDEFLAQLTTLAALTANIWCVLCPSNGAVATEHGLTTLLRTYANLLQARLRTVAGVNLLVWPPALEGSGAGTLASDSANQQPFDTPTLQSLAETLARSLSSALLQKPAPSKATGSDALAAYLEALKVEVTLSAPPPDTMEKFERILRLTSSFTLTGELAALSQPELESLLAHHQQVLVQVKDRTGAHGASGVVLCRQEADQIIVAAFALSCPVLGRQVEFAVLQGLSQRAAATGAARLRFLYSATARNSAMREFLERIAQPQSDSVFEVEVASLEPLLQRTATHRAAWQVHWAQ
ncbi:MAG: hypothetical protein KGK08_11225 [Acidobacteriota bacterium]|nr:hypothetical protein [Acidobacteriota bacterium]